jgi:hypothetical protein
MRPENRRRSNATAGRLALLAVVVTVVVAGMLYWRTSPDDRVPDAGLVQVRPAAAPSPAPPARTPAIAQVAPKIPGPLPGPPVELKVTPDVLQALKLPPTAVFRDTTLKDADDRVICGEVARSPGDRTFRRFVYIAESKAGFVDDGGAAFAQIDAATCAVGR